MKFGKLLQRTIQLLPEIEEWLIQYKALKQQVKELKLMQDELESMERQNKNVILPQSELNQQYNQIKSKHREMEQNFIDSLNKDLEKFNDIFVDKEELAVISMSNLDQVFGNIKNADEAFNCKLQYDQQYADLFQLLHWVLLSFAGINKILKKHDKLTGKMLKDPYIHNVLQQPFYSTKYISEYIRTCKERIAACKDILATDRRRDLVTEQQAEQYNKTMWAMQMWMELSANASTPSTTIPKQLLESLQLNHTPLNVLQVSAGTTSLVGGSSEEAVESRDVKRMRIDSKGSSEATSPKVLGIGTKKHELSAEDLWAQLAQEAVEMPLPFSLKSQI